MKFDNLRTDFKLEKKDTLSLFYGAQESVDNYTIKEEVF